MGEVTMIEAAMVEVAMVEVTMAEVAMAEDPRQWLKSVTLLLIYGVPALARLTAYNNLQPTPITYNLPGTSHYQVYTWNGLV